MKLVARRAAAALSAVLVTGLVAAWWPCRLPGRSEAPGSAGSSGIGDPYFPRDGNGGYDVAHYDIHDAYRLRSGALSGRTAVSAVATPGPVLVQPRPDAHAGQRDRRRAAGEVRQVRQARARRHPRLADRHGHGASWSGSATTARRSGCPGAASSRSSPSPTRRSPSNQPHIAPWWFPVNDHPRDKATYDITVAVAARQPGDRQRHAGLPRRTAGAWTSYALADDAADGQLPRVLRGRPLPGRVGGQPRRCRGPSRSRSGSASEAQDQQLRLLRDPPGIVRWLATQFGRYPFDSTGGVMTSLSTGLRAGEPEPADVPVPRQRPRGALHRRARARAPVVRRRRSRSSGGATSGSTRASRPGPSGATTRRTAGTGAAAPAAAAVLRAPRLRPVLAAADRATRATSGSSTRRSTTAAR